MKKAKKMSIAKKRSLTGLVFVTPWIAGFLIFFLKPLVQSVVFSMNSVKITATGRKLSYVGIGNFRDIFTKDAYFVDRLVNFLMDIGKK